MNLSFNPKTKYEQFGKQIAELIVENFSETFYVGGMIRDQILNLSITDIDLTTSATPNQVIEILEQNKISYRDSAKQFGVIVALDKNKEVEIATLRTETYPENSRFPRVEFVSDYKLDSQRRDFTINSLYLRANSEEVYDPQNSLKDLEQKLIRTVGEADKKFKEDPLRIVRALVLKERLDFEFEPTTQRALLTNLSLVSTVSKQKIDNELEKLDSETEKQTVINFIKNS